MATNLAVAMVRVPRGTERAMDRSLQRAIAMDAGLGLDPLEFRLKNLLKKGELYTPGDTPVDCDLAEGVLRAAKEIGLNRTRRHRVDANAVGR